MNRDGTAGVAGALTQALLPSAGPSQTCRGHGERHEGGDRECSTQQLDRQLTAATVLPSTVLFTDVGDYNPDVDPWNPGGLCSAACRLPISCICPPRLCCGYLSGPVSQLACRQTFSFAFHFILWSFSEWPHRLGWVTRREAMTLSMPAPR